MGSLLSSMAVFVPCDRKLQRAYSATFADEETWFELIGTAGQTISLRRLLMDLLKLQAQTSAYGNDSLMKQMLNCI